MISFEQAISETNVEISATLNRVAGSLKPITTYLNESRGQGVRTQLLLLCAANQEGMVSPVAPKVATAIELIHMATLLHDDVIDDAVVRRGQPSVQSKFGKKEAILVGDYLLCLALNLVANLKIGDEDQQRFQQMVPTFSQALASVCTGEFEQHLQACNLNLSLFDYLKIIRGKTAALFYLSAYMGALLAKEDDKTANALGTFGRQVGLIFQILDDCKDYSMTQQKVGKPVASDLLNGVVTLPLILTLKAKPKMLVWAKGVLQGEKGNLAPLVTGVQEVGVDKAKQLVLRYVQKAHKNLKGVSKAKTDRLIGFLNKFTE